MTILEEDIISVINAKYIDWYEFKNKTIAISGATGLIGNLIIKCLLKANTTYELNISIICFVRDLNKFHAIFENHYSDVLIPINSDMNLEMNDDIEFDYLIHCAGITDSQEIISHPVNTIMTAIRGTNSLLELAIKCKAKSIVYLSSMEVYGTILEECTISEDRLGYIDILNERSSYSEGKRICECLCYSFYKQYGLNIKIARLSQTFGAGINQNDTRIVGLFTQAILKKEDLILHTNGEKENCFCYTTDAVGAIILLLLKGSSGEAYNIANKNSYCSIYELAKLFAEQGKVGVKFEIPPNTTNLGYSPCSKLKLDVTKLEHLGWNSQVQLEEMIYRTVKYVETNKEYDYVINT